MRTFNAKVIKLGINPCVDVPTAVVQNLLKDSNKTSGPVQVKASVNRTPFEANVVKYSGAWILYLNTQIRLNANVEVGDSVHVALAYDPKLRMPETPDVLKSALNKNKRAKDAWRLQPRSRRKEVLLYLNSLKTQEALIRNTGKVIRLLLEKKNKELNTIVSKG